MEPDVVSNENPIKFQIFLLIFGLVAGLQIFLTYSADEVLNDSVVSVVSILNPLVAAGASFWISHRYKNSKIFGKAYFVLGLAFVMVLLGEFTYLFYDLVLNEDPYPSIADVFFISFDLLALYHLKLNIGFFNPHPKTISKIWVTLIPIAIVLSYSYLAYEAFEEFNFDYYYGVIFVAAISTTFSFTILGASSFKGGTLGYAWLVLVIGILSLTIADAAYFYLELFEGYSLSHPVNLGWYAGYMIIVYALYMHKKAI